MKNPKIPPSLYKTHSEYMKSPEWQARRTVRLKHDGYRCVCCGETSGLQVHHSTYENLGAELLQDMVTLCIGCHNVLHDAYRRTERFTAAQMSSVKVVSLEKARPRTKKGSPVIKLATPTREVISKPNPRR